MSGSACGDVAAAGVGTVGLEWTAGGCVPHA